MSKGIFTAASGAVAQSTRLDTIANNLANVNTPGFKRDSQVFREYLTSFEKEPSANTVPRVTASIDSFYDLQGGDKSFVETAGTSTDFVQGSLKQTQNDFDFALEGDGFFEISTPSGVRYTRAGNFTLDSEGRLVTKQSFPVLLEAAPGTPLAEREIRIESGKFTVTANGEIHDGDANLGRLSIVTTNSKDALQKFGTNLFTIRQNYNPNFVPAAATQVKQGYLEMSNVNIVKEMTDMIGATRVFETSQKAISAYDQMAQKLISEVPRLK